MREWMDGDGESDRESARERESGGPAAPGSYAVSSTVSCKGPQLES